MVKQIISHYQKKNLSWPKDWFLKFVSVLFAAFLWYFVAGEDRVDMSVQIPIEIVNLPRDMVISNQFKNVLEVTVSGPRGMIKKISQQAISRSIDLSGTSPGNVVINNAPDSIQFPRGISVLRINPSQIALLIDRLATKTTPIEYITTGSLPSDFILDSITLQPATLSISGPQEIVKDVVSFKTTPINLSEITNSSVKQVSLDLAPEIANLIGESIVTASIKIKDKMVPKTVRHIPIVIQGLTEGQNATIKPKELSVEAQIPSILVKSNKDLTQLFEPFVEVTSLSAGTHELAISLKPTPRIKIDTLKPDSVTLHLEIIAPPPTSKEQ